ncbi:response regulator [Nitrospina gracilis]|uniref:response regulator n=1 Tax=Nitrospina gracilis TaxID=35801 RepID=UPI001F0095F0|nr:response regulator [Nitrospina gracilis]MCF8719483.1 DNA-binding response OmpR family regulator [Nitrospina gracilis Nb-211]
MNVLLIDSDKNLLHLIEGLIEFSILTSHLKIETVDTPHQAAQMALQSGPEFVVIDPQFSKEWGMPLIKTLKEIQPNTVVFAFSNCLSEPCFGNCREQCLEAGADRHFDKAKDFLSVPQMIREKAKPR